MALLAGFATGESSEIARQSLVVLSFRCGMMPYCTLVIWFIIYTNRFTPMDWVLGIASGLAVPAILLTITRSRNKRAYQQTTARV